MRDRTVILGITGALVDEGRRSPPERSFIPEGRHGGG